MLVAASGCERWASRQWERCNRMWRLRQNLSFVIVPFELQMTMSKSYRMTPFGFSNHSC